MAAPGSTPIQLYYSTTASAVPSASNLALGELALNANDGALYYKNSATGNVTTLVSPGGVGSVTSFSFTNGNGFSGTVATATTTPTLTLTTTVNGIVKGNGTALSAAVAGTDYLAPFGAQTASYVYAAPANTGGVPAFRALTPTDIPTLNQNTTGSASSLANTGGWSVTPSGTKLLFAYNGVTKGSLDSSGNFIVTGNVTAYGTP